VGRPYSWEETIVSRARLPFAILFMLPLAACSKEAPPVPAAEPPATSAKAEATAVVAPPEQKADALEQKAPEPEKAEEAKAPSDAKAKPAAAEGGKEIALPKPKNGVLGPGEADKILAVGARPKVSLLEAGAEPRADLSYVLVKGATQKFVMGMDMVMGMTMAGKSLPPTAIPRMNMAVQMTPTDKNAAGEWKIDSKVTSISLDPKGSQQEQMAAAMRPQVEGMKGLGMSYWMDPKGQVRDVKTVVPPGLPASAQQMLSGINQSFESIVAPLPKEPVGVGAKWQVISRVSSSGADLVQAAVYTLKARSGDKITLDVKLTQLAASDTIKAPNMPPGISANLKSFDSTGGGSTQGDVKSGVPGAGKIELKTAMAIAVAGAGGAGAAGDSAVDTKVTITISHP